MSAPDRPPHYFDAIGGGEQAPGERAPFLIDTFAGTAEAFAEWLVEDCDIPVDLSIVAHEPGKCGARSRRPGARRGCSRSPQRLELF